MKSKVKSLFIVLLLFSSFNIAYGQQDLESLNPEEYLDFWVGTWQASWEDSTVSGGMAEGQNKIEKILNDKVIKENFEAYTGGYKGFVGKSYSVYNPNTGQWKQTWVDNQGGYLDFIGKMDGNKRIFMRTGMTGQEQEIMQRMVFYNITDDSFTWDWETSNDNGKTWDLRWRIFYKRAE